MIGLWVVNRLIILIIYTVKFVIDWRKSFVIMRDIHFYRFIYLSKRKSVRKKIVKGFYLFKFI